MLFRSKRAIQFIPLLVGWEIMAGIGMGIGGIASSATFYHTLSKDFTDDIESGQIFSGLTGPTRLPG